jgi:hypothetical protein
MSLRNYPDQVNVNPLAFTPNVVGATAPEIQIDFTARIEEALTALNDAANAYEGDKDENGQSKTARSIETSKLEHLRLLGEANAAKQRLDALIAAGSALEIYNAEVSKSESALQKLVELLTKRTQEEVIEQWFGGKVPLHAISNERKADLRLHVRVQNLRRFHVTSTFTRNASPTEVAKRADVIGTRLVELAAYIAADQPKGV